MTAYDLSSEAIVLLVKLGASNVLVKPIAQEEFIRMRRTITKAQSLEQQRKDRSQEGGARAVTHALVERLMATGRLDGGHDRSQQEGEAEFQLLLLHREPEMGDARKLLGILKG